MSIRNPFQWQDLRGIPPEDRPAAVVGLIAASEQWERDRRMGLHIPMELEAMSRRDLEELAYELIVAERKRKGKA